MDIYDSDDNSQSSQEKIVASSSAEVQELADVQKKNDDLGISKLASKKEVGLYMNQILMMIH